YSFWELWRVNKKDCDLFEYSSGASFACAACRLQPLPARHSIIGNQHRRNTQSFMLRWDRLARFRYALPTHRAPGERPLAAPLLFPLPGGGRESSNGFVAARRERTGTLPPLRRRPLPPGPLAADR